MEPLSAEKLIFSGLIRVVTDEVGENVILTLLFRQETVVVLPNIRIVTGMERFGLINLLSLVFFTFFALGNQKVVVSIRHKFVFPKQTSTGECLNLRWLGFKL